MKKAVIALGRSKSIVLGTVGLTAVALAIAAGSGVFARKTSESVAASAAAPFEVKTALAREVEQAPLVTLPATITSSATGRSVVTAPFDGLVVRVDVLEGQSVRAGQPIAEMFSPAGLQAGSALAQARAEMDVAAAAATRARTLVAEGIVAAARAEEADARLTQARAALGEQQRLVQGAGVSAGRVILRAPISGRVTQLHVQAGQGLTATTPAAVVDQEGPVWIEARLPGTLVGKVSVGDVVDVDGRRGRVTVVGAALDPASRSVLLRAALDDGAVLPLGALVQAVVLIAAPENAVELPIQALTRTSGDTVVLVWRGGLWTPVPVQIVGRDNDIVVVTGVAVGEKVAASDLVSLKASLGI